MRRIIATLAILILVIAFAIHASTAVAQDKKAANPCNPDAAKKVANPCSPDAAKKAANPCSPDAAKKAANPCSPGTEKAGEKKP